MASAVENLAISLKEREELAAQIDRAIRAIRRTGAELDKNPVDYFVANYTEPVDWLPLMGLRKLVQSYVDADKRVRLAYGALTPSERSIVPAPTYKWTGLD